VREGRAHGADGGEEVDRHCPVPVLVGDVEEAVQAWADGADVVDEDVDGVEPADPLGDEGRRSVGRAQVDQDGVDAFLISEDFEFGAAPHRAGHHADTFGGQ
jgi:hypothetical protein